MLLRKSLTMEAEVMKKSSWRPRTIHVVLLVAAIGAAKLGWTAGYQNGAAEQAGLRVTRHSFVQIAEEIEERLVTDEASIVDFGEDLGSTCAALAKDYTGYSYGTNMLKIAHILDGEVSLPDHETRHRTLVGIGQQFLDAGCSTGFLLQMIQRAKSIERYVDGELYKIAQANG
jgi:hypothetical protein